MWSPTRSFRSLAGQFLVFQLLVVAVVLVAVAAVSVAQSTREFREVRGQRMIAVAENMASTPVVRDRYADQFAGRVLAPEVDRAVALSGAARPVTYSVQLWMIAGSHQTSVSWR